ncbi:MAG: PIN domain-containing protein [Firmicutes bacterium]|nr:PIN domain-containing protein [Bacillota bacterium]
MGAVDAFRKSLENVKSILIDTNIVIYFLDGTPRYASLVRALFEDAEQGHIRLGISTITELELLVKPIRKSEANAIDEIEFFLDGFPNLEIIPVTREIAWKAAHIRAGINLGVPDAILIATASQMGFDVILGNDKECSRKVKDPPYLYLDGFLEKQA